MTRHRFMGWLSAAAASTVLVAQAPAASAEEPNDTTGPGIAGGALLGAEIVLGVEAAFGVKPWWGYLIGGVVGAGGGAAGGYFAAQDGREELPVIMLCGGLVLIVPTVVAVLSASAYEPPRQFSDDQAKVDIPMQLTRPGLLDVNEEGLSASMPSVSVNNLYSDREVEQFGEDQGTEVQVQMLNVTF